MRSDPEPPKPGNLWAGYDPDAEAPWDLRRVVHLHRRAGASPPPGMKSGAT